MVVVSEEPKRLPLSTQTAYQRRAQPSRRMSEVACAPGGAGGPNERSFALARIRASIDDFEVEEIALYPPVGIGEHTFLWVEKRNRTTAEVAVEIAAWAHVAAREVGFAGRKDRRAITRQWFSVPGVDPPDAIDREFDGWQILDARRHRHKLRTGQLVGNRFRVVVRDVGATVHDVSRRVVELTERGMMNRFGRQRFGRDGDNAAQGASILRGERVRGSKRHRRFLVSALQSAVFNEVLEKRPAAYYELLCGDVAVVHSSGGQFLVQDLALESPRAVLFEISATGPIFGKKMKRPGGAVADFEKHVLEDWGVERSADFAATGIRFFGTRRAFRVRPSGLELSWDGDRVELHFELPAGSYATVLIEDLFQEAVEEGAP